jgi:hypothetical protein
MKRVNTVNIAPHSKGKFLLGDKQTYFITSQSYINPDNPGADAVFKPIDATKIKVSGGPTSFEVENELDTGINIEIYETE